MNFPIDSSLSKNWRVVTFKWSKNRNRLLKIPIVRLGKIRSLDFSIMHNTVAKSYLWKVSVAFKNYLRLFEVNVYIQGFWGHLRLFEVIFGHLRFKETTWGHKSHLWNVWGHLRSFEVILDNLRSYEAIWCHLRLCEAIWGNLQNFLLSQINWGQIRIIEVTWGQIRKWNFSLILQPLCFYIMYDWAKVILTSHVRCWSYLAYSWHRGQW